MFGPEITSPLITESRSNSFLGRSAIIGRSFKPLKGGFEGMSLNSYFEGEEPSRTCHCLAAASPHGVPCQAEPIWFPLPHWHFSPQSL